MQDIKTVIVVLNYNDYETTANFVSGIKDYSCLDKIIVVDNNSSDHSAEVLSKLADSKIDFIKTDNNLGYGYGNNFGIEFAKSKYNPKYIIISNPDIVIKEDVVENLLNIADSNDSLGLISCNIFDKNNKPALSFWKKPGFSDCIFEQFHFIHYFIYQMGKKHCSSGIHEVDVIPGCFFIANTKALYDTNGFDNDVFLFYEENMLAHKLKEKGYTNYIVGDYFYVHNHSVSVNRNIKSINRQYDITFKSRKIYCKRYLQKGKFAIAILTVTYYIGKFNFSLYNLVKTCFKMCFRRKEGIHEKNK